MLIGFDVTSVITLTDLVGRILEMAGIFLLNAKYLRVCLRQSIETPEAG